MGLDIKLLLKKFNSKNKILSPLQLPKLYIIARCYFADQIRPRSCHEDIRRREFIFNILLLSLMGLAGVAFLLSMYRFVSNNHTDNYLSPIILFLLLITFGSMYFFSRKKFRSIIVYVFVGLYFVLGTYSLILYSYSLPIGLLIYVLVIIISGILISSRAAALMTLIAVISLILHAYSQHYGLISPYTIELNDPPRRNLILYIVTFLIIFLVSWLSNREIEKSLYRARASELALIRERDKLEVTVKQRTKELEKAQLDKMLELYKFAEFGRVSSSLVHDIANPLTSISLNLQAMEKNNSPEHMMIIKAGISYLEQYIQSARHQLRGKSPDIRFNVKDEIKEVSAFLSSMSQEKNVFIETKLENNAYVFGDKAKFRQVIANLIANSIDSYGYKRKSIKRRIIVNSVILRAEGHTLITVNDFGVGISKADLPRIFEPFFTTKSLNRGTGIGLAICKEIIEKDFNGRISVHSVSSKGTTFALHLPICE